MTDFLPLIDTFIVAATIGAAGIAALIAAVAAIAKRFARDELAKRLDEAAVIAEAVRQVLEDVPRLAPKPPADEAETGAAEGE